MLVREREREPQCVSEPVTPREAAQASSVGTERSREGRGGTWHVALVPEEKKP